MRKSGRPEADKSSFLESSSLESSSLETCAHSSGVWIGPLPSFKLFGHGKTLRKPTKPISRFCCTSNSSPILRVPPRPIQSPEEWAQVSKELDSKNQKTEKSKKLTKKLSEINENGILVGGMDGE